MSETVRRALRVLGFLGERPRKVDEVAGFMGLHRTTALRTLQVLEAERFVTRDEGHAFRLASGLYYLANRALENTDLERLAVFEAVEDSQVAMAASMMHQVV
ncbi:MAG: helix-turn-helix domain-containing protein [bacterium]|nr:helix-turn-helix domain-containing protein [bacterium]